MAGYDAAADYLTNFTNKNSIEKNLNDIADALELQPEKLLQLSSNLSGQKKLYLAEIIAKKVFESTELLNKKRIEKEEREDKLNDLILENDKKLKSSPPEHIARGYRNDNIGYRIELDTLKKFPPEFLLYNERELQNFNFRSVQQLFDCAKARINTKITSEPFTDVVSAIESHIQDPELILKLAEVFSKNQLEEVTVYLCELAVSKVQVMQENFARQQQIFSEMTVLETEEKELESIKQLPKPEDVQRLHELRNANLAFHHIPYYDLQSADKYEYYILSAARLSLRTSHSFNSRKTARKSVGFFTSFLKDPKNILEILQICQAEEDYFSVLELISKYAKEFIAAQNDYYNRDRDIVQYEDLKEQKNVALKDWKLLDSHSALALRTIQIRELQNSFKLYKGFVPPSLLNSFFLQYITLLTQISLNLIDIFEADADVLKIKKFKSENLSLEYVRKVFSESIALIEDPQHLYNIAKLGQEIGAKQKRNNSDLIVRLGEKCQVFIKKIDELRNTLSPLKNKIYDLREKRKDLIRRKRNLTDDESAQLIELTTQVDSLPKWPYYADLNDVHQYEELNLDILRVMTSAILDRKDEVEKNISYLLKEKNPSEVDKVKINAERAEINQKVSDMVKMCLENFYSYPKSLLKFQYIMVTRQETNIVLQVAEKIVDTIDNIESLREVRLPIHLEFVELEKEIQTNNDNGVANAPEKLVAFGDLKDKLDSLPAWPHFANLTKVNEFFEEKKKAIFNVVKASIEFKAKKEKEIADQCYNDPNASVKSKPIFDEYRRQSEEYIRTSIDFSTALDNPKDLVELANFVLSNGNEVLLIHRIYDSAISLIGDCHDKLVQFHEEKALFQILTEELLDLKKRKKSFLPEDKDLYEKLEQAQSTSSAEYTFTELSEAKNQILLKFMESFSKSYNLLTSIKNQQEMTKHELSAIFKLLDQVIKTLDSQYFLSFITLSNVINTLFNLKLFDYALKVAKIVLGTYSRMKQDIINFQANKENYDALLAKKDDLDKRLRKQLDRADELNLRILRISDEIYRVSKPPKFVDLSLEGHDNAVLKLSILRSTIVLDKITAEKDNSMDVEGDKNNSPLLNQIIDESLEHIVVISNIIDYAKFFEGKFEYQPVIKVGLFCEKKIEGLYEKIEEKVKLQERLASIDMYISSNPELRAEHDTITKLLKKEYNHITEEQLKEWTLTITSIIMNAATIENDFDTLKEQSILAFKVDTTEERWSQVRNVTAEEEWVTIKETLVSYMLNNIGNINDKIELLLKDGLYKQCVDIFPAPTGEDDEEVDRLVRLWNACELNSPALLENVLNLVGKFIKKYFQDFEFEAVYGIVDRVQRVYPNFLLFIYKQATDMIMLNILQSQYSIWAKCLKDLKRRLTHDIDRPADWTEYLDWFRSKYKSKKKLVQIINQLSDSSFNLESLIKMEEKKKSSGAAAPAGESKKRKRSTSPSPKKRTKKE